MSSVVVHLYSWNRYVTRNFAILPELLGAVLQFKLEGYTARVKLPASDQLDRGKGFDEVITVGARRASDNEPLEFIINKVDIEVEKPERTEVPDEALTRNANAYELFSQKEQQGLNDIAENHRVISEKAFEYWIRILRWKCDDGSIGRPELHDYHSGWSTHLHDIDTKRTLWIESQVMYVRGYIKVNRELWIEVEQALQQGLEAPIYIEYKHDGEQNIKIGDLNRGIVDLAISCETYLRLKVSRSLPRELERSIVGYIENTNIQRYIDHFFPSILSATQKGRYQELKPELHRLFNHRNEIVHEGKTLEIDFGTCMGYLQLTKELLKLNP